MTRREAVKVTGWGMAGILGVALAAVPGLEGPGAGLGVALAAGALVLAAAVVGLRVARLGANP